MDMSSTPSKRINNHVPAQARLSHHVDRRTTSTNNQHTTIQAAPCNTATPHIRLHPVFDKIEDEGYLGMTSPTRKDAHASHNGVPVGGESQFGEDYSQQRLTEIFTRQRSLVHFSGSASASSPSLSQMNRRRSRSERGTYSSTSPLSEEPDTHFTIGTGDDTLPGRDKGASIRHVTLEEELEERLASMTEIAKKWKKRYCLEKDESARLFEKYHTSEQQCRSLVSDMTLVFDTQKKELQTQLQSAIESAHETSLENINLKEQLEATTGQMKTEIQGLNKDSETKIKQIEQIQFDNAKLEAMLRDATCRYHAKEQKLRMELKVLTHDKEEADARCKQMDRNLCTLKSECIRLQDSNENMLCKISELQGRIESLTGELLKKETILQSSQTDDSLSPERLLLEDEVSKLRNGVNRDKATFMPFKNIEDQNIPMESTDQLLSVLLEMAIGRLRYYEDANDISLSPHQERSQGRRHLSADHTVGSNMQQRQHAIKPQKASVRSETEKDSVISESNMNTITPQRVSVSSETDVNEPPGDSDIAREGNVSITSSTTELLDTQMNDEHHQVETPTASANVTTLSNVSVTLGTLSESPSNTVTYHITDHNANMQPTKKSSLTVLAARTTEHPVTRRRPKSIPSQISQHFRIPKRRVSEKQRNASAVEGNGRLSGAISSSDSRLDTIGIESIETITVASFNSSSSTEEMKHLYHRSMSELGPPEPEPMNNPRRVSSEKQHSSTKYPGSEYIADVEMTTEAGTRASGFGALRQRRNGIIVLPALDIAKQHRKSRAGTLVHDVFRKLSRDHNHVAEHDSTKTSRKKSHSTKSYK